MKEKIKINDITSFHGDLSMTIVLSLRLCVFLYTPSYLRLTSKINIQEEASSRQVWLREPSAKNTYPRAEE